MAGAGIPIPAPLTAGAILARLGLTGLAAGSLIYATSATAMTPLALGTAGRLLVAGASAPAWSDAGLSYASSVLTIAGSVPGTPSAGQVLVGGGALKAGGAISGASLTASGLTSGRVPHVTTAGLLTDAASLTFGSAILTVGDGTGAPSYVINGAAAQNRPIVWKTNGVARWDVYATSSAESGANAGTDFGILARTDAGAVIDAPVAIVRAAGGAITLARPVTASSTLSAVGITSSAGFSAIGTIAAGTYYFNVLGASGAARDILRAGLTGYSNGLTVQYNGSAMVYGMANGALTVGGAVTVADGTAAAPGWRLTSEAHGQYRISATSLGFAVAGAYAASLTNAGVFTSARGVFNHSSSTASDHNLTVDKTFSNPSSGGAYRCFTSTMTDQGTGSDTWYNQQFLCEISITSSGSNAGYDRVFQMNGYHRGSGTRNNLVGAKIDVGTYNGGSDSTGIITLLQGINITTLKTTSSAITTSALLDLGANVGTTKYAIRSLSTSGIVSLGDTTDASAIGTAAVVNAGGASIAKNLWVGGTAGNYINIANSTGELRVNGTKVLGAQGAAVADVSGGATIDAEARTTLNTLLARARAHGWIAT